ncbi:MAG: DUF2779 domain-containing protein [bacterium]
MGNRLISKSSFIRGMQCHKSLWLHLNEPEERSETSEAQQQIFDTGHNIGSLAQQLFPGGVDASRGDHSGIFEAITYTSDLIGDGQKVIYEAAFSDGETLCYMDILVKEVDGWAAYEVKASTQVKEYQVNDVAFQYYVITRSGLPLQRVSLVHLNNQYVRRGEIDIRQLFTIEHMTERILPMQQDIPTKLMAQQEMLKAGLMPEIPMEYHCHHPFNCDFLEFCRQNGPTNDGEGDVRPANRDQDALDEFLSELEYPLYSMDFETIQFAIPRYDESRSYQQIPFQYSLHVQQVKDGSLDHFEFLGTPLCDPRPEFIESLLSRIGDHGSILVWNQAFENTRLRELARDFPEVGAGIDRVINRMADLAVPFRRKHLTMPEMHGSWSLKAVLPAMVPDLSYGNLDIQEGGTASMTYDSLYSDEDAESIRVKRENLLAYCKMDTLSVVRILEMLTTFSG